MTPDPEGGGRVEETRTEPEFVLTDQEDGWDRCWIPTYAAKDADEAVTVAALSAPLSDAKLIYFCDGRRTFYRPKSADDFEWEPCEPTDDGALEMWEIEVGDRDDDDPEPTKEVGEGEVTVRLTREEAEVAADWIRGHRPRGYPEDGVWGRALDRAVNRLRAALSDSTTSPEQEEPPKELDVVALDGTILDLHDDSATVEVNFSDGSGEIIEVPRSELKVTWRAHTDPPQEEESK